MPSDSEFLHKCDVQIAGQPVAEAGTECAGHVVLALLGAERNTNHTRAVGAQAHLTKRGHAAGRFKQRVKATAAATAELTHKGPQLGLRITTDDARGRQRG